MKKPGNCQALFSSFHFLLVIRRITVPAFHYPSQVTDLRHLRGLIYENLAIINEHVNKVRIVTAITKYTLKEFFIK